MKSADILTFHPGKQHNLEQAGQLVDHFPSFKHITSVVLSQNWINRMSFLPKRFVSELAKRSAEKAVVQKTDAVPWYELEYKYRRLAKKEITNDFFRNRNRYFQQHILKKYNPPKVFIGFDTSSNLLFKRWKGKSKLLLDLTIAVPQYKLALAEKSGLAKNVVQNLIAGDEVWYDIYKQELELADYILCGSNFVADSCRYMGVPEERLVVIPYGANLQHFQPRVLPDQKKETPFRIAFVGNVSYRKGADVLLQTWTDTLHDKFPQAELHFFGNLQIPTENYNLDRVHFHGFITQEELIRQLEHCQVSLLPTFFEGSSYAIYQSMALGLGVITTPNCGSQVIHQRNGLLIDYGAADQLVDAVSTYIENPELRIAHANQAMIDIQEYSWNHYGAKLRNFLANTLGTCS